MRLTQRLLLGSFFVVGLLVVVIAWVVDRQLRERLRDQSVETLIREARYVGSLWVDDSTADALADSAGVALRNRVTLIAPDGRVVGESDDVVLAHMENHATRPEIAAARDTGVGTALRASPTNGDIELYAAVSTNRGVARVAMPNERVEAIVRASRRDVASAGFLAIIASLALAGLFSRAVSRPVEALRDVAQAMAAGDLSRRPALNAPGEVGDLATALHRLGDQLGARINALRSEEALLAELAESLNEGVLAIDMRQQVVRINEMGRRLLGVTEPTPFGMDQLPRDRVLRTAILGALNGESIDDREAIAFDRPLNLTARPLAGGGAVIALFDLTPLRQVDVMRRDFVANVSHELRTPLTVVSGFAETLATDDPPPAARLQFAKTILNNTKRMQRIVDDLLDLSRIESGGWVPNPAVVDVVSCATDTITNATEAASKKGLMLEVDVPEDAATMWADPTAIRQVMGNLVDNAVRHTASGTVAVFSRKGTGGIEVGVRDTGIGIAPEHLSRIFERFYRVDAGRSREEGGTGLGLSIVRHLVEAHGGSVRAESERGVGTTISATFPEGAVTGP